MKMHIYPSLMAADPLNIGAIITQLSRWCHGFHLDLMDDHYVPNIALSPATINAIARITDKHLWIHLMVTNPLSWPPRLTLPPGSIISFHPHFTAQDDQMIALIHQHRWLASIAISPDIDLATIYHLLPHIDHVLIMGVHPGFSGQPFIASTASRIASLAEYLHTQKLSIPIGADGGITMQNAHIMKQNGVRDIAIGSAIFDANGTIRADCLALLQKKAGT